MRELSLRESIVRVAVDLVDSWARVRITEIRVRAANSNEDVPLHDVCRLRSESQDALAYAVQREETLARLVRELQESHVEEV